MQHRPKPRAYEHSFDGSHNTRWNGPRLPSFRELERFAFDGQ